MRKFGLRDVQHFVDERLSPPTARIQQDYGTSKTVVILKSDAKTIGHHRVAYFYQNSFGETVVPDDMIQQAIRSVRCHNFAPTP
jgi:hypothetical protein